VRFVEWFYPAMSGLMKPLRWPLLCGICGGNVGEISCSVGSGGAFCRVVQAGSGVNGRILSALYLALPSASSVSVSAAVGCSIRLAVKHEGCGYSALRVSAALTMGFTQRTRWIVFRLVLRCFCARWGFVFSDCDRALLRNGSGWREGTRTARSAVLSCPPKR
jgi:hypothetical protein